MNRPAFSRSGNSSAFGKRTQAVRSLIPAVTKDALERLWRALGYPSESEFLAELIEIRVHGVEHVESLRRARVRAVAGIGTEKGVTL